MGSNHLLSTALQSKTTIVSAKDVLSHAKTGDSVPLDSSDVLLLKNKEFNMLQLKCKNYFMSRLDYINVCAFKISSPIFL